MASVPQQVATSTQPTTTSTTNVSAAAVNTALQALKDAAISSGTSNGATSTTDPTLVAALLHLIQSQKTVDQDKGAAAEILSTLSQTAGPNHQPNIHPQLQDAGPNSHPHGPPMLGVTPTDPASTALPPSTSGSGSEDVTMLRSRRRGGPPTVNGQAMNNEEWARQRKDNHKEVERRRRGNINEGINELARLVPNSNGDKAKGAILSRSVQYIHHLRENEARNIEKWTLEKLLMDQAMHDLKQQMEEVQRMWQEEVKQREKGEAEIAALKAELATSKGSKKRPNEADEAEKSDRDEGSGSERDPKRTRSNA